MGEATNRDGNSLAGQSFADAEGAAWEVRFSVAALGRIRQHVGIDLDVRTRGCRTLGDLEPLLPIWDLAEFLRSLHAVLRPQAADRGLLNLDDFAERFDTFALIRARAAFVAAYFESRTAPARRARMREIMTAWRAGYEASEGAGAPDPAVGSEGV